MQWRHSGQHAPEAGKAAGAAHLPQATKGAARASAASKHRIPAANSSLSLAPAAEPARTRLRGSRKGDVRNVPRGCTCRRSTAADGGSTTGFGREPSTGPGRRESSPRRRTGPTRTWTGQSRCTPRSCTRTSTRPPTFVLTDGHAGDVSAFPEAMARLPVPRPRGRPRTGPDVLLPRHPPTPAQARTPGGHPPPVRQLGHRLRRRGRPPASDRQAYKQRNTVERCINGAASPSDTTRPRPSASPDSVSQPSSSGPHDDPNEMPWLTWGVNNTMLHAFGGQVPHSCCNCSGCTHQ